jgi:hypothetical protein
VEVCVQRVTIIFRRAGSGKCPAAFDCVGVPPEYSPSRSDSPRRERETDARLLPMPPLD